MRGEHSAIAEGTVARDVEFACSHLRDHILRTGANLHNKLAGVWWPIGIASMTFLVGTFMLNESHRTEIWKEAEEARPA